MYKSDEFTYDKIVMNGISDMVFVIRIENESEYIYKFLNRSAMEGTELTHQTIQEIYN
ncbi:hypothetical protein ACFQ3N_17865 [Virgibacillus byunsanensis]|uniref:KTSC domain-containing protein n=1 Tax=Virgibacillus byunsanensis TaxID=570945 RepID=A0ABW3LR04_9BACI